MNFDGLLTDIQKTAWIAFKSFCFHFCSNKASGEGKIWAKRLVESFEQMGCLMSVKVHYIHNHLDKFPANPSQSSDEMGERAHQDLKLIEKRFAGKNLLNALCEYCWTLTRESDLQFFRSFRGKTTFFIVVFLLLFFFF